MREKIKATTWVAYPETQEAYSPIIKEGWFGDFTEVAFYYGKLNKLVILSEYAQYLPGIIKAFCERYGPATFNQVWNHIEWR